MNASAPEEAEAAEETIWFSPENLIGVLTTVLVPLVFGVIVVVGE